MGGIMKVYLNCECCHQELNVMLIDICDQCGRLVCMVCQESGCGSHCGKRSGALVGAGNFNMDEFDLDYDE